MNAADVDRDMTYLLKRWIQAFEARDLKGVRSALADDDRFLWLEDGEPRYRSADDIVRAYASFPKEFAFTHVLRDIRRVASPTMPRGRMWRRRPRSNTAVA